MADTTITIRGVDTKAWKEFQRGIVSLHGNLYGNIGQEATNALKLWLERYKGKESADGVPHDRLSVSYNDIGGLRDEIQTIREMVEMPLKHSELFRWLNLIPSKGVLIHGPPGTGKNLLARVATKEAKARLYILSIKQTMSEFNEMGLRGIFKRAKENAPSVVLIPDLVALDRQKALEESANQILSWLVSEIDSLDDFGRVVVIGIGSSPEELEPSLMQRFRQDIKVSLPDRQGRYEILKILTKKMPLADDVDLGRLADITDQYQGILLWRICQEAATQAFRRILEHEELTDEEIPKERLEQIEVDMDDFLHGLNSVKPENRD
ncbi:MAG: AAA family ATPase [Candidatus Bathyarchaeia archaeon]